MKVKKSRKSKSPNPRPKIDYPPVATKTWIPPEDRPKKKPQPKYVKPPEVSVKLDLEWSTLVKVWHNFRILGDRAILVGSYSQYSKRYTLRTLGYQGPCNCVVAIAVSKLLDMTRWSSATLDKILDTGDSLYLRSIHMLPEKYKRNIKLCEVYHTYYIDDLKLTMDIKGKKYSGKILPDRDDMPQLADCLKEFFETQQSGVLIVEQMFFALFMVRKGYYFFDPLDHERDGSNWMGLQGHGYSLLTRVSTITNLVPLVQENLICMDNPKFTLVPCNVLRKVLIAREFPCCLEYDNLELKFPPTKDKQVEADKEDSRMIVEDDQHIEISYEEDDDDDEEEEEEVKEDVQQADASVEKAPDEQAPEEAEGGKGDTAEASEDKTQATQTKKRPDVKAPVEKVKAASVTYFIDIVPQKVGILRACTHQCDPNFSKYLGKQSIANAVAAVGMLRMCKSKYWTTNILDDILKLGEVIYHDSMKALRTSGDTTLKVTTVCKVFTINEKDLTPQIEDHSVIGKLNSRTDDKLDLLPALKEFFCDNDACILCGPVVLAVWMENQTYYMFDPNERDNNALVIVKQVQIGSFLKVYDVLPGVACLTWYANLKDLVDVYMRNVPKSQKTDQFVLCKIQVDDYVPLPEAWHNFQPLSECKWILKGNFSQNNKRYSKETRNTQCTAMAAMCIAMKELKPVKEWETQTLDQILDVGDKYYEACVNNLKDNGKFVSGLLLLTELMPKYIVEDQALNFEIDECVVNGNISYPDNDEIANLKIGFRQFFEDYDTGILTCRSQSVAVWKQDEMYYCFDSHSRNDEGIATYYGTSMVIRVQTIEDLTKVILGNLGADTNSQYNISNVKVMVMDASAGVPKPPLNNFTAVNENIAILRSTTSQNDEKFKINTGKQTIPNSLVAFGMTMVYPTQVWSKDTMDEILNIGDKLYADSMEAAIEAEEKKKEEAAIAAAAPPDPQPPPPPPPEEKPPEPTKKRGRGKKEEPPPPPPPPEPEPEPAPAPVEEDDDSDDITTHKVLKEFKIGVNNFTIELGSTREGTHADLLQTLNEIYVPEVEEPAEVVEAEAPPPPPPPAPATAHPAAPAAAPAPATAAPPPDAASIPPVQNSEVEDDRKQMILESELLTVAMWKEDGLYYIFDPKPRDPAGQVYGKDEWSVLPPPEPENEPSVTSPEAKSLEEGKSVDTTGTADPDKEKEEHEETENPKSEGETEKPKPAVAPEEQKDPSDKPLENLEEGREAEVSMGEEEDEEYEYEGEEEISDLIPPPPKHSPSYWIEQEKAGKAYTMRFLSPADMVKHIVENTPPTKGETPFKLTEITITNEVKTKDLYDPELGPPEDKHCGDWKNFKEIDYGRWILRGTMHNDNPMFPEINRGKQTVAMSFIALAYATLYSMPKFTQRSVDDILIYGDRLYSFTLNARRKELKELKDLNLGDSEVEAIVQSEEMGLLHTTKHFCICTDKVRLEIDLNVAEGEINAQDLEEELDVKRGLEQFFHEHKIGLISAKNLLLAIWRKGPIFYMFDPQSRGPNGLTSVNGVACITRYLDLEEMAQVFIHNLCKEGDNRFFVHCVTVNVDPCPREEHRKKKPKLKPTAPISSFDVVVPGKTIVRGTISQEHQMFGRRLNAQFAPMTFVALAMTLVHKAMFWTKPIIDEIVIIGDQLYGTALDNLGYDFNSWEQNLTVDDTPTDFKIGELKANCEVRPYDQRGIVNVKNSSVLNLRQGLERFFEENTHGVIETEPLTLAVWEESEPTRTLYIFDPCARGPTGMPLVDGAACVLTFDSPKLAADHFASLIPEYGDAEFTIRPVEVVVGKMSTKGKKQRTDCPSKSKLFLLGQKIGTPADKRRLKEMLMIMKRQKEEVRRRKLGKKRFYKLPGTEIALLRGNKHLGSSAYSVYSRYHQAIPVCLMAYIMERLLPFDKWSCNIIDMVLDIGDQLYKDSYLMYSSPQKDLGLNCIIREIVIKDVLVNIAIGRPVLISQFSACKIETALELCFRQKNFCMICTSDLNLAIFFKEEHYYVFDPRGLNIEAKRGDGCAATLLRFNNLNTLASTVVEIYVNCPPDVVFTIILVAIKSIRRMPKYRISLTNMSDQSNEKNKEKVTKITLC